MKKNTQTTATENYSYEYKILREQYSRQKELVSSLQTENERLREQLDKQKNGIVAQNKRWHKDIMSKLRNQTFTIDDMFELFKKSTEYWDY